MKKNLLNILIIIMMLTLLSGCNSADNYYKAGQKSFKGGEYEKAADSFSKAIAKNPNRADYFIDYGLSLVALGKYDDALAQFDQAYMDKDLSIIQGNNKKVLRGKGIAYYFKQDYANAVKELQKALKIDELPELDMDIRSYLGSALRASGFYEKAIDTYTTIIKDDNKNAEAYADRAFCYRKMSVYDKSLADYNSAIELEPDNFDYYFGKYDLLKVSKDDKGAKETLTQASEIKAETDADKYNLAKLHFYQEDYDTAQKEFENSYSGGNDEASYYIGEIYRIKKDYTNAVYYYENYISTGNVNSPDVYNQAAVCLMKTGDYDKAIEYLDAGIAYNNADTLETLTRNEIIAYEYLGDFETADEKLKEYLADYPDDQDAVREAEFIDTRLMDAVTEE